MRKITYLIAAYAVVLHLLTFALLEKVEAVPKLVNKIGMTINVRSQLATIARDHPNAVLLGDSHTWLLGDPEGAHNFGISGIMVADVAAAMPPDIDKASVVMLMIGTNDIWRGKTAGLPARLDALAARLPPGVPVIWSAIPPGDDFRLDLAEVRAANKVIRALCAARPGCAYLDTWAFLADAAGKPISDLFVSDGVHLSAAGYRVWLNALDGVLDTLGGAQ